MQKWLLCAGFLILPIFAIPVFGSIQVDGVAAYVNGHVITVSDVLGASSALQQRLRESRDESAVNALYLDVLEELIERKLIADAYEKQREIKIPSMMVDERVQEVVREMFNDDRNAFLRALGEEGRSEKSWRAEIHEQVVVRAMRNLRVDRHVRVSPTEVRARYDENPALFERPAQVTYRMLVVSDGEVGPRVQEALAAGTSFADVTSQYSSDAFAGQGGLRGPVDPAQLREEIRMPLTAMKPGAITGPVTLGSNLVWLQLEAWEPSQKVSFADVYSEIEMQVFRERAAALQRAWLTRLRAAAFVEIAVAEPF